MITKKALPKLRKNKNCGGKTINFSDKKSKKISLTGNNSILSNACQSSDFDMLPPQKSTTPIQLSSKNQAGAHKDSVHEMSPTKDDSIDYNAPFDLSTSSQSKENFKISKKADATLIAKATRRMLLDDSEINNPLRDVILRNLHLLPFKENEYEKSLAENMNNNTIIISHGTDIFRTRPKTSTKEIFENSQKRAHSVTISNVENPEKLRSPVELKKSVITAFPEATDARLLPLGDVCVYFPSNEKVLSSLNNNPNNFGTDAKVGKTYETGHKAVIHNISSLETQENLKEALNALSCDVEYLKIVPNRNFPMRATAFVTLSTKEQRNNLISRGKIPIGFEIHRISAYDRPKVIQCYKCQEFGHISKICKKENKCLHCAGNHRSIECTLKKSTSQFKCANCSGNHKANSPTCQKYKLKSGIKKQKRNINKPKPKPVELKVWSRQEVISDSLTHDTTEEAMLKAFKMHTCRTDALIIKSNKELKEQLMKILYKSKKNSNEN
jgi:hypothetical protein